MKPQEKILWRDYAVPERLRNPALRDSAAYSVPLKILFTLSQDTTERNICPYDDNQTPQDRRRAISHVMCSKYPIGTKNKIFAQNFRE
jgi:hypothetical protein